MQGKVRAVFVQATESSTGARHDIEGIAKIEGEVSPFAQELVEDLAVATAKKYDTNHNGKIEGVEVGELNKVVHLWDVESGVPQPSVTLPESGHMTFVDQPGMFEKAVEDFRKEMAATRTSACRNAMISATASSEAVSVSIRNPIEPIEKAMPIASRHRRA